MRVSRSYLLGTLSVLLVIGAFVVAVYSSVPGEANLQTATASSDVTSQATPSAEMPPATPADPDASAEDGETQGTTLLVGVPAIQPSILGAAPNLPGFTENDVREYASRHTDGFGRLRVDGQQPSIDSIQFLTPAALRAIRVEAADLPVDHIDLLCYVVYSGDFVLEGRPGFEPVRYKHVMQVFDAHTGNLLSQVAYERKSYFRLFTCGFRPRLDQGINQVVGLSRQATWFVVSLRVQTNCVASL